MQQPRVPSPYALSIVIPTHGRGPKLQALLERLGRQTLAPSRYEVVVVDDGSPEPVEVDAARRPYRCELLRQPQRGPGAARNRGLERCSAPLVLILNDDAVPAADLLERHLAAHADAARRDLGHVAVLGTFGFTQEARRSPFVRLLDETDLLFNYKAMRHDALYGWQYFWTCNISAPRDLLFEVGGFDGNLFDAAIVEDVELGYRLEQRGLRVLYREDCVAQHDHVVTPRDYLIRHSRLGFYLTRMWAKHGPTSILGARTPEEIQERFDRSVNTIELLRQQEAPLLESLDRIEVQYADQTLPEDVSAALVRSIRSVTMARWHRGIHLARHGVDAYKVMDGGAPAGIRVGVVVVSCNALENTQRCIESLIAAQDPRYPQQIVVVDNGSTDGSVEWLVRQRDVQLVRNPANHGAPRARNQALRILQERGGVDWYAFLDNDVVVPKGWLDRALYHGAVDPQVGSVPLCANRASKLQVVPYDGPTDPDAIDAFALRHFAAKPRHGQYALLFTSLAVLVRAAVIDEIGGFDEAFSPWGFEDDDLALRVTLAGWRNRVARDTFVHHAPYATRAKAEQHQAWMEENWRHFVRKWCRTDDVPRLFDYSQLRVPRPGEVECSALRCELPSPDAPPPRWSGDEPLVATESTRIVEVVPPPASPLAQQRPPQAARSGTDWWSAPEPESPGAARARDGRANVVVLGSGRSGTSMVTGMLAEAGWYVGDDPYPGREANPKGFFETLEINGINECLLSTAVRDEAPVGHMQHWLVAPRGGVELEVEPGLMARMKRLGRRAPFAYKDPRFCHTLPAWRDALQGAKHVVVFRDPATTAASIVKECETADYLRGLGVDFVRALDVWKSAYRRIVDELRHDGEWLFLHYEQLFTREGVAALERFVGAPVAADFPERALHRSRPTRTVDADSASLYDTLCQLAGFAAAPIAREAERAPITRVGAPELSVVVCTYNRLATLQRCLASFERQTAVGRYEIVVVDDGATDGTGSWLDCWQSKAPAQVVHQPNGGLAAARNAGLARARGRYVLFVNDDTIAAPDLVERHIAAHARSTQPVAVLGTFEQPRAALDNALMRVLESTHMVFCYEGMRPGEVYDWTRFWTCNVSVARELVNAVGGFDESFQHYGCEDTDLAFRLHEATGMGVLYDASARAEHEHVLTYEDVRRRTRTVAGAWTQLFAKHPRALLHPTWRSRARTTVAGHEELLVRTLPQRGRAEAYARELSRMDLGAMERTGPEGVALARAVEDQLRQYLRGIHPLWWAEGERDAFRRLGVEGMTTLVTRARAEAAQAAA
jgi:GT2 family glycosyltransferase